MTEAPFEVGVIDVKRRKDVGEDFLLLDVREESEYRTAHIDGSTLISIKSLPQRAGELPKDKAIIVHCHHGGRSRKAVQWLRANGFANVSNLSGGIDAWSCLVDNKVPRY